MYYNKRNQEEVEKVETSVYVCQAPDCNVWMRKEFVTQNLHYWIDLVFGFKQRGEAALEATNVFHHLSYKGAKDLDAIEDEHERVATIGIIHNFGQTPHQIFQRPHERNAMERSWASQILGLLVAWTRSAGLINGQHTGISRK